MTDERFFELCKYERQLAAEGYSLIAGIDEAGRGPLAGPVAAACVIFKSEGPFVKGADDSKKLSEKRRESLFEEIKEKSFAYGISLVDNHRIDEINILQATYEAMRNALTTTIRGVNSLRTLSIIPPNESNTISTPPMAIEVYIAPTGAPAPSEDNTPTSNTEAGPTTRGILCPHST